MTEFNNTATDLLLAILDLHESTDPEHSLDVILDMNRSIKELDELERIDLEPRIRSLITAISAFPA